MSKNTIIYDEVVRITEDYLGPAGERFIRRQIATHLDIEPESLDKKSIPKLVDWTSIALALLTDNSDDIEEYKSQLNSLKTLKI